MGFMFSDSCELTEDTYDNAVFNGLDVSNSSFDSVSFYRCRFERCNLQYVELRNCEFEQCSFNNCNLSLAVLNNTKVIDTGFYDSKLLGINWSNVGVVIVASFVNSVLDNCAFGCMNLTKVKFNSCSLVEAVFSDTKLKRVKFDDCDFERCQFHQSDMSHADFRTSRNYYISTDSNNLHKARFSLPEAVSLLANLDIKVD